VILLGTGDLLNGERVQTSLTVLLSGNETSVARWRPRDLATFDF
jgi:hypothetical protein